MPTLSKSRSCIALVVVAILACTCFCGVAQAHASRGDLAVGEVAQEQAAAANEPIYRLYNPYNGDHHYTTGVDERDMLSGIGWSYEGVAWRAPSTSATPVYRLYNPYSGDHHYTTSVAERDDLDEIGWNYEGVAWYSDGETGAPLYRLYNKWLTAGTHHYTTSAAERNNLVSLGWVYEGVAWYGTSDGTTSESAGEPIMGTSQTTVAQMVRRYNAVGKTYPSGVYSKYGAATINEFCQILYEEAAVEGVRAEVVFAQAMHETGWLQFGGDVSADQCNFAGIGATGGVPGNSFNDWGENSVRKGLRAQVQHLKAYASTESCVNEVVDPRYNLVSPHGKATTVEALGGLWATSSAYGDALVSQIDALLRA